MKAKLIETTNMYKVETQDGVKVIHSKEKNYTAEKHEDGWIVFSNKTNWAVSGYKTKKIVIEIMERKENDLKTWEAVEAREQLS